MRVWRLVKEKWASSAFDGKGAQAYPGRWNSAGRPVIYTASTPSLACLEVVVSASRADLLVHYVAIPAEIPSELVKEFPEAEWPPDWNAPVASASTKAIGDKWLDGATSLGLAVPSSVSIERNVLINPLHADFPKIKIGTPLRFPIDPRLAEKRP